MTRQRLATMLALAFVLLGTCVVLPTGPSSAVTPGCRWSHRGFDENLWLGGSGRWSDATRWSKGVVPGTAAHDYACVPEGSEVVVDLETPQVDLEILELGRNATLTLQPGTALFVWGNQTTIRSITKRGSLIEVDGATLGGPGLLHVIGKIVLTSKKGAPSPELSTGEAPGGRLEVGPDGTLAIDGEQDAVLGTGYAVDVLGHARLVGSANLLADPGSRFALLPREGGRGVGELLILRDKGFLAAPAPEGEEAVFVNRGKVEKRGDDGNSVISATYWGGGRVQVHAGYLVLPDEVTLRVQVDPGAGVGSGTCVDGPCVTETTMDDQQFASLSVPATAGSDDVAVAIEELSHVRSRRPVLGVPVKVHALHLDVSRSDPAVIELRYDATLLEATGLPVGLGERRVFRKPHRDARWVELPLCDRGAITSGPACFDRRTSRTDEGDEVLVVLTTVTSRWRVR